MRLAGLLLLLSAAPALAQSSEEEATTVIVQALLEYGFAEDVSLTMSECYTSRMTEDELAAVALAEGNEERGGAVDAMAESEEAVACFRAALVEANASQ